MSGGGKSSTSTSSVSIPPEVLARYNAVNTRAEQVAQQPFTPYGGQFVAPLTQTQQAGMANINQAAGQAQPYYGAATQSLLGGASQAQPFYYGAAQNVYGAQAAAQPYQSAATGYTVGAGAAAQPLQNQALSSLAAGQAQANPLLYGSIGTMQQGAAASSPYIQRAGEAGLAGVSSAMGTQQQALSSLGAAAQAASPYYQATQQSMTGATLANQPFANLAAAGYAGAQGAASPYQNAAAANLAGAQAGAQPLQGQAAQDVTNALSGAQPYQQTATQLGLAGARQISPEELATDKYMSPYMKNVVESTMQNLRQQQQQEQSQILGSQIASGAFGGDRGRIAQANLARQQGMATGQTVSGLLNQGYSQALAAAQQQQGVALGAEQANRAAQAQAAQQMAALGQQGFGQNLAASQQRAALGQQGFGQALATAQQQAALGQQLYGQQMGVAQAQQGLGAQGFAQNMAQAQMNQALAQQMYSQGANTAQVQAAIAQQQANQGMQLGQLQAGLGSQVFGQGAQIGQQQANVGQALFGQGATAAQQQAALAQQAYAQQMGQGQQLAAIGQQGFGQGLAAAQAMQGIGQGLYGMGAGVSQGLAGLGTGAQAAALQGGQAQLAAGTLEQQTQQAQNQALYNQFLQQQGYPFQVAQFLANIAMGTGALSGSTTTTTQPSSFFSDKRLKDDIEPIGKTFDGQDIVRFKYKGEPATRIGLVAQDVEKKHPDAVGLAGGYKTVDYDRATDEAAARAPKASGGGLNPWTDASMGGGVFREDAGAGFAAGGMPGGDILAQINELVNAHQGMYPYGKTGLYGATSGKAGPYGSSLMQVSPRLMTATPHRMPEPEFQKAIENVGRAGAAAQTVSSGLGAASKGYDWISEQLKGLSTPSSQPYTGPIGGGYVREELPPLQRAYGGEARSGLALGGMPYSEAQDEYVPEELSKPLMPQTLQAPKTPGQQQGGLGAIMGGLGSIGQAGEGAEKLYKVGSEIAPYIAALFLSKGGAADRHGYQDGGEPTLPEEWRPHISEASRRFGVPEHILTAVARQESQFGRAAPDNPMQITEGTARNPGFGLSPIALEDRARPEAFLPFAAQYISARNPNVNWEDRPAAARALASTYNAGGDPNYAYNVGRYIPGMSQDDLDRLRVNTNNQGLGAGAGSSQAQPGGLGNVQPEALPILRGLTTRRDPESKDFMQRNQDWIVPLLTGLGTMASSPSRYLGSAILQGVGGGAQQYAAMQQRGEEQAIQREQVDVSRLREINQAMQMQEQMRQRLLEAFGPRLEGNMYLNPYSGEMVSAQQRMAIVNSMMSNMARQMGLPAMTGAEAAGGLPPGQRPAGTQQEPPADQRPAAPTGAGAAAPGAAGTERLTTPATGTERPTSPDAAAVSAGRGPDITTAFTVDTSSLRGPNNPDTLEQEASALLAQSRSAMQQGLVPNAQLYQEQAKEKLARADQIRSGALLVRDENGQLFRGFAQATQQRARYEEEQKKVEEEYAKHASEGVRVDDTLRSMTRNFQSGAQLGAGSTQLADVAAYIQTVLGTQNTSEAMNNFVRAVQVGRKDAIMTAFNALQKTNMSRGTNMALQEMLAMVAEPNMSPSARYEIVTRARGEIARDNAFYDAAIQRDPRESIAAFQARWNANPNNRVENFVSQVRSQTRGFTGMTPQEIRRFGAAGAPVPPSLDGREGLEYDKNTGQFRAPAGRNPQGQPVFEYFDINGRPAREIRRP